MRDKKDYLPKLLEFIDLTNQIPVDFFFPRGNEAFNKTRERLNKNTAPPEEVIETLKILLKDLPVSLFEYVFTTNADDHSDKLDEITAKIDLLNSLEWGLRSLAYFVMEEHFDDEPETRLTLNQYIQGMREQMPGEIDTIGARLSINKDGFLEINSTEFYDLIANHNIEATRIRLCPICEKVFWATRLDKWTCSKACGNILRQRNWQAENRDDYNERRRENYAYKKSKNKQKKPIK